MKTVIKILIALVVINAVARFALARWDYYQLTDSAQQMVLFGATTPTDQIQQQIAAKAAEMKVPLYAPDITVRRDGFRTIASGAYTDVVELFPGIPYPFRFTFEVEAFSATGTPAPVPR